MVQIITSDIEQGNILATNIIWGTSKLLPILLYIVIKLFIDTPM